MVGAVTVIVLAFFLAGGAAAQEPFPSRPLTLVVPFAPGGTADLTARPLAAAMEKVLKNPVVVVNKTGAAGAVGTSFVANARPDGYTLLLALSSISIIPEADRLFGRKPAYSLEQFVPIALISADPTILVVHGDRPWKSIRDLVEDARKRPGEIAFSSSGMYGPAHLSTEMFSHAAGIKLRHVPYAGAGPGLTALLGGHVDALSAGPAVVQAHIKSGKLRALAGWGAKRIAALPDVPTLKELGYDVEFYVWVGAFAPTGTPAPIRKTLRDAVGQAVKESEFQTAMAKVEVTIAYLDAPEFHMYWERDAKTMAEVVKRVGRVEEKK